jgi:methylisocitrate lyase
MPGCADPLSARIFERMGFKALSVGGWVTGAQLAIPEPLLTMTEQVQNAGVVAAAVDIPVRADAHTGFGDPIHVIRTVRSFEDAGVAAVHIEDQLYPKRASYHRGLEHVCEIDEYLRRLEFALEARRDKDFMIFARTDAGNAHNGSWKEAARRARAAKALGVDGLLPHTRTPDEMEKFRQEYPDNDLVLQTSAYFNSWPPEEIRKKFGFQVISYPLAPIIASMAGLMEVFRGWQKTGVLKMNADWAREVRVEIEAAQGMSQYWEVEKRTVEAAQRDFEGRHILGYEGYKP